MKITIAHLYYDVLNLYGECGNIRILKKALEEQGIEVIVQFLTMDDQLHFDDYDLVYMGMGIADHLVLVNDHLSKYKKDIQNYIENDKYFICTGNSYELFGKEILFSKKKISTLGIFDYKSKILKTRRVNEIYANSSLVDDPIIGFMNTGSSNDNSHHHFLHDINGQEEHEGIIYKNFIGTYVVGPLLIRNPSLLKKIVQDLINQKDSKYSFQKFDFTFLDMAYQDCLDRKKYSVGS